MQKKLKIIHISSFQSSLKNIGVMRQLEYEYMAAKSLSLNWVTQMWVGETAGLSPIEKKIPWIYKGFFLRKLFICLYIFRIHRNYDYIIFRCAPFDFWNIFLPLRIKRKIIQIHHTKSGYALSGLPQYLKSIINGIENILQKIISKNNAAILSVTNEIANHELERIGSDLKKIIYPNGIYLENWKINDKKKNNSNLVIAFIATRFYDWNGLEDLISNLNKSNTFVDFELHLIGRLSSEQISLIKNSKLSKCIFHKEYLTKDEIDLFLQDVDITLGAFNLSANNMTQACTLKVRESLASGVPVYSGHDDVFPENFQYYKKGDLNWSNIFEFCSKMKIVNRSKILEESRELIDKTIILKKLHEELLMLRIQNTKCKIN